MPVSEGAQVYKIFSFAATEKPTHTQHTVNNKETGRRVEPGISVQSIDLSKRQKWEGFIYKQTSFMS